MEDILSKVQRVDLDITQLYIASSAIYAYHFKDYEYEFRVSGILAMVALVLSITDVFDSVLLYFARGGRDYSRDGEPAFVRIARVKWRSKNMGSLYFWVAVGNLIMAIRIGNFMFMYFALACHVVLSVGVNTRTYGLPGNMNSAPFLIVTIHEQYVVGNPANAVRVPGPGICARRMTREEMQYMGMLDAEINYTINVLRRLNPTLVEPVDGVQQEGVAAEA